MPYFIDFGFGEITRKIEAKSMDIHLFEKSFNASFPEFKKYIDLFKEEYFKNLDEHESKKIKKRLEKIQNRGRYK